jgi:hypothetical protein
VTKAIFRVGQDKTDLLIGNLDGTILVYLNEDPDTAPDFLTSSFTILNFAIRRYGAQG